MSRSIDCERSRPIDKAASYCDFCSRNSENARRPTSEWAFIVLPDRMPTTGMSAIPVSGTVRVSRMIATTGANPLSIATPAQGQAVGAPIRRAVVIVAMVNMTTSRATDRANDPMTAVISSATTESCSTARPAAITGDAGTGSRPTAYRATVMATSRTTAAPTGQPGSTVTRGSLA